MSGSKRVAAIVAATDSEARPRIEIVSDRRRVHDASFRALVVAEAVEPGARIQDVSRRHGVCPSLIYRWRRLARSKATGNSAVRLLPVRIAAPQIAALPASEPPAPQVAGKTRRPGVIEIELAGGVRVSVDERVNAAALRRVLSALRE
jgi:transposase